MPRKIPYHYVPVVVDKRKTRASKTDVSLPADRQAILQDKVFALRAMSRQISYEMHLPDNGSSPEDLLQDTMIGLLLASNYPPPDEKELLRWAFRAMRNTAISIAKGCLQRKKSCYGFLQEQENNALPDYWEEKLTLALSMVDKLKPAHKQVVTYYLAGYTGKEIQELLGITHATVRTRHHAAHNNLRKVLRNITV